MKRTILAAVLASALVLTGCGNNEDEQAKTAISKYLVEQQSDAQVVTLKKKDADCISDGMVEGIGVDQLKKYGFLNEDGTVNKDAKSLKMSKEDSKTMVDSMFDCTDVMATVKDRLASQMGTQSAEVKKCVDDAVTEKAVRAMLEASFAGDQATASKALIEPLTKCAMAGQPTPKQ